MSNIDRQELKRQVIKFYNENIEKGKAYTVNHFKNLGETQSCIYHYIRQAENGETPSASCRAALAESTNHTSRGRVSKVHVQAKSVLPNDINLHPRGDQLLATCRQRCGAIYSKFQDHDWILDNKCMFTYRCNQGSKYRFHYTFEGDTRPQPVIYEEDLVPRLVVWIAFSKQGICQPFIQSVDEKFSARVFYEKCLRGRLLPFVKQYHDVKRTVVWTDASSVTSNKRVFDCLESEGIKYVSKDDNPGNRVRCCSYFWTMLKNAVYDNNWIAENDQDLERRIQHCLSKIDLRNVMRLAADTENRIYEMYHTGEIKTFSDQKQKYTH